MICAILYMENSDKDRFSDLKKRVDKNDVLNKAEYIRTVTAVQILLLNYQPNYNSNGKFQFQGVINQLMSTHHGKTGDDGGDTKYEKQKPRRTVEHITCNYCGEK